MLRSDAFPETQRDRKVLSVSQLTGCIKETLELGFPSVWVGGELCDVSRPRSGHIYLTLKDEKAQLRGVIWRSVASRLPFELEDGQQVICRGEINVYAPRGSYQIVIRQVEPQGVGALQMALRALQQRLAAEGLFDPARKKPLPRFPRRVALVTSPTGAAVRDFLEVVRRRWQGIEVLVIPCRVQGAGAAAEIARGVRAANRLQPQPDVLVVTRGGGSLEDLWSFNEEEVVRAIYESQVPVVSAVGHEIDVSLSDLAADVRALTPTEAAERVVPSCEEVLAGLRNLERRLCGSLRSRALQARSRLESLAARRVLRRPLERVYELQRRLDELHLRSTRAVRRQVVQDRRRLAGIAGRLESLSPLAVLARGYSVTLNAEDRRVIQHAGQVQVGDRIVSRLRHGELISRVEGVDGTAGEPFPGLADDQPDGT